MDKPTVGMNLRRGGAKLRTIGRAHGPLLMLLWQAREAENALLAAATAQKALFTDVASWASSENRALSDVCSNASELSNVYTNSQVQLAQAYRSFRKDMSIVLEGEKRCDVAQKKLQGAENKRLKLRRQVLRAQNRVQIEGENIRHSGDFSALQTQLAESERIAERAHMDACEASREQEAVKLVVVRTALSKLSQAHLCLADQSKSVFEASCEIANELPEPPPPGDALSSIRYTGFENTRAVVNRVKSQVQLRSPTQLGQSGIYTSTPITSPNSSNWNTPEPSAPVDHSSLTEPPPPYNTNFFSAGAEVFLNRLSQCCSSRASPEERRMGRSSSGSGGGGGRGSTPRRRTYNNSSVSPLPSISGNSHRNSISNGHGHGHGSNPGTTNGTPTHSHGHY